MNYKNFEELPIWKEAKEITKLIYQLFGSNDRIVKNLRLKKSINWCINFNYE